MNEVKQYTEREAIARLRWQCRRGMLELDLMLQPFVDNYYPELTENEQCAFRELLRYPDQELQEILLGNKIPGNKEVASVSDKIRQAVTNRA